MPTRIVLNSNPVPSEFSPQRNNKKATGFPHVQLNHNPLAEEDDNSTTGVRQRNNTTSNKNNSKNTNTKSIVMSSRRTSGFRSSILRELSVRQSVVPKLSTTLDEDTPESERVRISSGDIRASPRFLGYLFCTIAGSVLLVSVVQFYKKEVLSDSEEKAFFEAQGEDAAEAEEDKDEYFITANGDLIYRWKLWGAIWASSGIVGLCLLVMLVHYDTTIAPKFWMAIFRDGSLAERNLILFMLLVLAGLIHVCTSSLSVGQVQANVYFTSWIAFGSIALTYGVWRESAGLPTLMDMMNQHKRETTYNWIWILIFSVVFAGAATDIYYNRAQIELRYNGEIVDLRQTRWIWVLVTVWAEVGICIAAVFLNEVFTGSQKLPCACTRPSGTYRCVFGWRQFEGLVIVLTMGAKFWVIWEYTGVDGVINGLNNGYFGIWGSFFNSVFALGTWLKENQNTEYFVRDGDHVGQESDVEG